MTKLFALVAFVFFAPLASASAFGAPCPDLSGDYFVNGRRLPEARYVLTMRQTGCDLIAVGGYTLANGTQTNVVAPRPMYVNEANRALCPNCAGFKIVKDAFEIVANGSIEVGKNRCGFDKMKLDLRGRDYRQTFFLDGKKKGCKKTNYVSVHDRYR